MSAIYDWATAGNLQPEPITVEIWRNLPEDDIHVLDHTVGAYRHFRALTPGDEVSVIEVPVRIKVAWNQLSTLAH
jgi:hypothetical protein